MSGQVYFVPVESYGNAVQGTQTLFSGAGTGFVRDPGLCFTGTGATFALRVGGPTGTFIAADQIRTGFGLALTPTGVPSGLKALTKSSATDFATISLPAAGYLAARIFFTIEATDLTDYQILAGVALIAAERKVNTVVAGTVRLSGTAATAVSTGTITQTLTCTAGSGLVTLACNSVPSLTIGSGTHILNYRICIDSSSTANVITGL